MTTTERTAIAAHLRQAIIDAEAAARKAGQGHSWQLGNLESKIKWLASDIERGEFAWEEGCKDGTLG